MAERGEVVEITIAVIMQQDCTDTEVTDKAAAALNAAHEQLLGIRGAKRYTSGYSIRRGLRMRFMRRGPARRYPVPDEEEGSITTRKGESSED